MSWVFAVEDLWGFLFSGCFPHFSRPLLNLERASQLHGGCKLKKYILVPLPAWLMTIQEKIGPRMDPHGKPVNKFSHVTGGQLVFALKPQFAGLFGV